MSQNSPSAKSNIRPGVCIGSSDLPFESQIFCNNEEITDKHLLSPATGPQVAIARPTSGGKGFVREDPSSQRLLEAKPRPIQKTFRP